MRRAPDDALEKLMGGAVRHIVTDVHIDFDLLGIRAEVEAGNIGLGAFAVNVDGQAEVGLDARQDDEHEAESRIPAKGDLRRALPGGEKLSIPAEGDLRLPFPRGNHYNLGKGCAVRYVKCLIHR